MVKQQATSLKNLTEELSEKKKKLEEKEMVVKEQTTSFYSKKPLCVYE